MSVSGSFVKVLINGYVHQCMELLKISRIMPISLIEIIYEYYQFDHLSFVMIGHVDSGKSTICGRLLVDLGDKKALNEHDKLVKESHEICKESFKYAVHMNRTRNERARGITIIGKTKVLSTDLCEYILLSDFYIFKLVNYQIFLNIFIFFFGLLFCSINYNCF